MTTFTLTNICSHDLYVKYLSSNNNLPKMTITPITDLNKNKTMNNTLSYVGKNKDKHNCLISMIDHTRGDNIYTSRYNCFWCRNPFDSLPLGCPIKFVPKTIIKNYISVINSNSYVI